MPSPTQDLTTAARLETQRLLGDLPAFQHMSRSEQLAMYKRLLEDKTAELARQRRGNGFASALAEPQKAGDLVDIERHRNKRIEQAGELAGEFVDSVNFPQFVRDLLKGVFDANLQVTLQQMQAYQNLLKSATQSLSKFVTQIDDAGAFGYLAENEPEAFTLSFDDEEKDEAGNAKAILVDKEGNKLDLGDNELKAKVMDAKLAMAREQRALLRETILMGITRLVVEKGIVKASVLFDIKASEKIDLTDKAAIQQQRASGSSVGHGTGPVAAFFGGSVTAGHTRSERKTQISISSAKSTSSTDLSAKLAGSVEINFKSDYFKLDNFATMYGPVAEPGAAKPPAGAPQLPPAPARV
jgi:hypothetical protein